MEDAERGANATLSIDLEAQEIHGPDGGCIKFDVEPFRKHCLLNGLDDIGLTLQKETSIQDFEAKRAASQPCCRFNSKGGPSPRCRPFIATG